MPIFNQISTKELHENLKKIDKIDQEVHQLKLVIFKYIKPVISQGGFVFNNLFGKWSSIYSEKELDKTLYQIRNEWTKEIKEII